MISVFYIVLVWSREAVGCSWLFRVPAARLRAPGAGARGRGAPPAPGGLCLDREVRDYFLLYTHGQNKPALLENADVPRT